MQKQLKTKRTQYILGLVDQFRQSDEIQTTLECYDYVKTTAYLNIHNFVDTLTESESEIFNARVDVWFNAIESLDTFQVFLRNHEINL